MKSTNTNQHLGVKNGWGSDEKFRDVRKKAQDDLKERKLHKRKKKEVKLPCYEVGDKIVLVIQYPKRHYNYVELIDFYETYRGEFRYYGVLLKTTHKKELAMIGHIVEVGYRRSPANVVADGIKWLS